MSKIYPKVSRSTRYAHLSLVPERFTILQYPPPPTAAPANVRVRS